MTSLLSPGVAAGTAAAAGPAVRRHAIVDSPVGPITLVSTLGQLTGLYLDVPGHQPAPETIGAAVRPVPGARPGAGADLGLLSAAAEQLARYFAGELTSFDLPILMTGTSFQRRVWAGLQAIPYGETISYGELARRIGQPSASRAVGLANGRNPVSIVVPCHRVIGASGSLTGYGGGLERKRFLLALESRVTATAQTLW